MPRLWPTAVLAIACAGPPDKPPPARAPTATSGRPLSSAHTAPSASEPSPGPVLGAPQVSIEVTSTGVEPRRSLFKRYVPGPKPPLVASTKTWLERSGKPEQEKRGPKTTVQETVLSVGASGTARVRIAFPERAVTWETTADERGGVMKEGPWLSPSGIVDPVPGTPLGLGAKWVVTRDRAVDGARLRRVAAYQLDAFVTADAVRVRVELTELPADAKPSPDQRTTGELTLHAQRLYPTGFLTLDAPVAGVLGAVLRTRITLTDTSQ